MRTIVVLALIVFLPIFVSAAALININTADVATLETLPHIGATLANRIIDYRTQNGPFTSITGLQKVSGIGSGSNYADIAPLITVSDAGSETSGTDNTSSSTDSVASSTSDTVSVSRSASPYVPPPSSLSVDIAGSDDALVGVPLQLSAQVTTKSGADDPSAQVSWGLGDGSSASGVSIQKIYRYAGTYLVRVTATDAAATAQNEVVVTVRSAAVSIPAVSGDGITVENDSNTQLDLSNWWLRSSAGSFHISAGTVILPNAQVLFPFSIMNMPIAFDASLAYPDGALAARFVPPQSVAISAATATSTQTVGETFSDMQPSVSDVGSSNRVQKVAAVSNTNLSGTAHDIKQADAPAVTTQIAAAGAAMSAPVADTAASASGPFKSAWALGLLGIVAAAGGAFIFL
ncbi:MAG: helix-hairpin-helix domain-containing protein [Minisyncoccia bacterium]